MRALLAQYGYQLFALVSLIGGPLVGLYVRRRGARIDLDARSEGISIDAKKQALDAMAVPLQLLKDELAKREMELAELREQDRQERKQHSETLTAIKVSLEAVVKNLEASREDAKHNAAHVHERLDVLDNRMLVIETRLAAKSDH